MLMRQFLCVTSFPLLASISFLQLLAQSRTGRWKRYHPEDALPLRKLRKSLFFPNIISVLVNYSELFCPTNVIVI
jgi:hypothetical protein